MGDLEIHSEYSNLFKQLLAGPPAGPALPPLPTADDLADALAQLEGLKQQMARRSAGGKDASLHFRHRAQTATAWACVDSSRPSVLPFLVVGRSVSQQHLKESTDKKGSREGL